ncbi:hypothetical protein G7Y89_g10509 [Cudoniella acicularis]|uniref:Microbial-type PARG catalytic domain-containing protein n=1 Tax=Cudoniella acicularis TaxID=354080 RepID=A0A8H4VYP5_9HELO|nr:hypothetical protein G7Y89_g10509 [Cudoniella acicularis]
MAPQLRHHQPPKPAPALPHLQKPSPLQFPHNPHQKSPSSKPTPSPPRTIFFPSSPPSSKAKVAILNMCSPLRPGGGFLNGALAQEESLCTRSTLYASLTLAPNSSTFYRLPSLATIYSPDILIFRSPSLEVLPKKDWYFVDVITAAAVRKPDLKESPNGKLVYEEVDREEMVKKVRMLFWVAEKKGVTHLVLGAWGVWRLWESGGGGGCYF